METIDLNRHWSIRCTEGGNCYVADVPATVANTLYENGAMEDPYYGENEWKTYELLKKDYEFTNTVMIPKEFLEKDQILLHCEGLDTVADLYLNGRHLAFVNDMHRTWEWEVKEYLTVGENRIRILFHSNLEYALAQHRKEPYYSTSDTVDGFSLVRKAHCSYGWDWGPKLPDMGIWKGIRLEAYDQQKLKDIYVRQYHEKETVMLVLDVAVERLAHARDAVLAGFPIFGRQL